VNRGGWLFLVILTVVLAACGGTPTPTLPPTPPEQARATVTLPTPYPLAPAPAGWPPATSFLTQDAWLALHVEDAQGHRWTVVAAEAEDKVVDEVNHREWVDKGLFLTRERHLWEALFRQAGLAELTRTSYLTECPTCPTFALAWRADAGTSRGIWLRTRPYDARGAIIPLMPVVQTLSLRVEALMRAFPEAGEITSAPPLPDRGRVPDTKTILQAVYGSALTWEGGTPRLGEDMEPWVLQVVPCACTAADAVEAVAIVGAHTPREALGTEEQKAAQARVALFQLQRTGSWKLMGMSDPLAMNVSAQMLGVQIVQAVDFDHDGRAAILVNSASLAPRYLDGVYHLYGWKDAAWQRLWTTTSYYDNTTLPEQPDYATQVGWPEWKDHNGDGAEDIVFHVIRRTYAREAPGFADTAHVEGETYSTVLFEWSGSGFLLTDGN